MVSSFSCREQDAIDCACCCVKVAIGVDLRSCTKFSP